MILVLWLSLAALPVRVEVEASTCQAAIVAFERGEIIRIKDAAGVDHVAVRVACEPCPCEGGPTS